MENSGQKQYSISSVVHDIKRYFSFLRKKWWVLFLMVVIGALAGTAYYFIQKPKYEAVSTFILEEKSASGSGLSGLASQFGFNIGSMGGSGSIFTGDNILSILKSKKIVQQVLITKIGDSPADPTLADLYLAFSGLKKKWIKKQHLASINFANVKLPLHPIQDSVLNVIYKAIIKQNLITDKTSKQGTIIRVQVNAENAIFARLLTERLVTEASKLYLDLRLGTSLQNIQELQKRADSLLALLNQKSYRAAASQPLDINPGIKTASVPVEIVNRDKAVLVTVYGEVVKNLEASKMILSQQTPVIQTLDQPDILLDDNKKSLAFLLFEFMGGAVIIGMAILLAIFFLYSTSRQ